MGYKYIRCVSIKNPQMEMYDELSRVHSLITRAAEALGKQDRVQEVTVEQKQTTTTSGNQHKHQDNRFKKPWIYWELSRELSQEEANLMKGLQITYDKHTVVSMQADLNSIFY